MSGGLRPHWWACLCWTPPSLVGLCWTPPSLVGVSLLDSALIVAVSLLDSAHIGGRVLDLALIGGRVSHGLRPHWWPCLCWTPPSLMGVSLLDSALILAGSLLDSALIGGHVSAGLRPVVGLRPHWWACLCWTPPCGWTLPSLWPRLCWTPPCGWTPPSLWPCLCWTLPSLWPRVLQCNNPLTKEPKLEAAMRIVPEWKGYDDEARAFSERVSRGEATRLADNDDIKAKGQRSNFCGRQRKK